MQPHSHKTPPILLTIYIILFAALAINPYDRTTWWVENIPILIVVGVLVLTYSSFKFSNFAYFLMGLFLCYHTIGGHFTFELVPFDWGNHLLSKLGFDFIIPEGEIILIAWGIFWWVFLPILWLKLVCEKNG